MGKLIKFRGRISQLPSNRNFWWRPPNFCWFSIFNMLHVTLLAFGILRFLLDLWKICVLLLSAVPPLLRMALWHAHGLFLKTLLCQLKCYNWQHSLSISRWHFSSESRLQSQARWYVTFGGKSDIGTSPPPRIFRFCFSLSFHQRPMLIHSLPTLHNLNNWKSR